MSDEHPYEDLEDLYENAPCGYLSLGRDGRIVKVNATFCSWTGFTSENLVGKRLRDLLNVAGSIFYETHFAPLLRMQGFFHEVALDLVTAEKKPLPVLTSATERRDADGKLLFTRITVFQARERRRYERDLVDAQEAEKAARLRLQELNATLERRTDEAVRARGTEQANSELREQFIAVLGHDLRNPLAAIDAGLGMLSRDGWTDRSPKIINLMRASAARMAELVGNVMDLARGRMGGGIVVQLETGKSMAVTLTQVIEEMQATWPDRNFVTQLNIMDDVTADHGRIAQLFSNLLGNAVTHGATDQPIRIEAGCVDGQFELSVANGGDPIPPEMVPQLFMPFHRGAVQPSLQGLGLGLYIANQIAEAHGGIIEVRSTEVETRFSLRMPAYPGRNDDDHTSG